jgi:hypothetical protein
VADAAPPASPVPTTMMLYLRLLAGLTSLGMVADPMVLPPGLRFTA